MDPINEKLEALSKERIKAEEKAKKIKEKEDKIRAENALALDMEAKKVENAKEAKAFVEQQNRGNAKLKEYYQQMDKKYPGLYELTGPEQLVRVFTKESYMDSRSYRADRIEQKYEEYRIRSTRNKSVSIGIKLVSRRVGYTYRYSSRFESTWELNLYGISSNRTYKSIKNLHNRITEKLDQDDYIREANLKTQSLYAQGVELFQNKYPEAIVEHVKEYVSGYPSLRHSEGYYTDIIKVKFPNGILVNGKASIIEDKVEIRIDSIVTNTLDKFGMVELLKKLPKTK